MSTLVIVLRAASLLAFAGPVLSMAGRHGRPWARDDRTEGDRAPLVANIAAFGLFFAVLLLSSRGATGSTASLLAASGALPAAAAGALVMWSRKTLGQAWSLVPGADHGTGPVTAGPYRLVRHPIYLGLALLAIGEALASRRRQVSRSALKAASRPQRGGR